MSSDQRNDKVKFHLRKIS